MQLDCKLVCARDRSGAMGDAPVEVERRRNGSGVGELEERRGAEGRSGEQQRREQRVGAGVGKRQEWPRGVGLVQRPFKNPPPEPRAAANSTPQRGGATNYGGPDAWHHIRRMVSL